MGLDRHRSADRDVGAKGKLTFAIKLGNLGL